MYNRYNVKIRFETCIVKRVGKETTIILVRDRETTLDFTSPKNSALRYVRSRVMPLSSATIAPPEWVPAIRFTKALLPYRSQIVNVKANNTI